MNRISIALLNGQSTPVTAGRVVVNIIDPKGTSLGTRPLEDIASVYGGVPVYVGIANFPTAGQYDYVVSGTDAGGAPIRGNAFVTVAAHGPELAPGMTVPPVQQKVVTEPGVTLSMVDSGVPPDTWHDVTVAQALAEHRPMVLYFGEPGFCPSKTCGPTITILKQLCTRYCAQFSFQHIEDDIPPGPAFVQPNAFPNNPAFLAFGLRSDPWVYFVNSRGVVTDRFEGPITLSELQGAADGTLAGHVPAVSLSA
ncbi:MAG: hypothetical protein M3Z57_03105 [Candidatus Dormibacteraeota bacterium]|nr:hypothetical protein [Candidatus Dormibacteraeota bacterium]